MNNSATRLVNYKVRKITPSRRIRDSELTQSFTLENMGDVGEDLGVRFFPTLPTPSKVCS